MKHRQHSHKQDPEQGILFTQILRDVKTIIEEPITQANITNDCLKTGEEMYASKRNKTLGAWLLGLCGFICIVTCVAMALLSQGILSPITIPGIKLGQALIGTAVASGVVATAGAGLFFWEKQQLKTITDVAYNKLNVSTY